jgi:hypothetical protein
LLSPPLTGSYWPLPHLGQGGTCVVEPTSISFPQLVQRYVPAETSLPAGTGFAMTSLLVVVGRRSSVEIALR